VGAAGHTPALARLRSLRAAVLRDVHRLDDDQVADRLAVVKKVAQRHCRKGRAMLQQAGVTLSSP
jgi:hypothetical protein